MLWGGTDTPFKVASLDQYMDPQGAAKRLTNVIDLMESGKLPKARVCNVLYRDLVANPVGTVAKIQDPKARAQAEAYDSFGGMVGIYRKRYG